MNNSIAGAYTPARRIAVIPMRGLRNGKSRLRGAFPDTWINGLVWVFAQIALEAVLQADDHAAVVFVSPDPELLRISADAYPRIIALQQPDDGLNEGLSFAFHVARQTCGSSAFYTFNADIPLISATAVRKLYHETEWRNNPCAVIAHDHFETGVNALGLYKASEFQFHFGLNSHTLHKQEARERNLQSISVNDEALSHDIDTIEDVIWMQTHHEQFWRNLQRRITPFS